MNKILMHLPVVILAAALLHQPAYGAACPPGIPCTLGYALGAGDNDDKVEGTNACDSDFMNQIYAKAFLEAEREMVVNETIIRKPDSILEYTCFDQHVNMTFFRAGDLFSGTDYWNLHDVDIFTTVPIPVPTIMLTDMDLFGDKLGLSLELLVLDSLEDYIDDNFGHDFLGGTAGIDSNIDDEIGGPNYNCDSMNQVWEIIKCDNFGSEIDFISFEELAADDPRQWPAVCGGTAITPEIIEVAENRNWTFAERPDPVDPFFEPMTPPGGPIDCGDPIPTGVPITRYEWGPGFAIPPIINLFLDRDSDSYMDKVCSNPSCYYDWEDDECEDN